MPNVKLQTVAEDARHEAMLLIGMCLLLVLFAWLRNRVERWLTHAVFRQGKLGMPWPTPPRWPEQTVCTRLRRPPAFLAASRGAQGIGRRR